MMVSRFKWPIPRTARNALPRHLRTAGLRKPCVFALHAALVMRPAGVESGIDIGEAVDERSRQPQQFELVTTEIRKSGSRQRESEATYRDT
jgi:hypothetical protein